MQRQDFFAVCIRLTAKRLRCSFQRGLAARAGIGRKNRRACKAKQVIILKILDNVLVHIAKLAAMALIKNQDNMLLENLMSLIAGNKQRQLLNRCNDDFISMWVAFGVPVFQLALQHLRGGVAVGRAFFKAVIFFHGLVVQILAVYHEQNFINIGKIGRQLRRFEGGQRFAAACCVPDVPACRQCSRLLVVGRNLNTGQNTLGGRNLVRTHHQQQVFGGKDAILRQDVQQRMAGKERAGKVHQIGNDAVFSIRPKGRKFKAVACLFAALSGRSGAFFNVAVAGRVGVVFRVRAVGDNENLHILIQSAARPKAVPLVTVDLVERLLDRHTAPLQFHMNQRQTVYQNRDIIAIIIVAAVLHILVDNLQTVVVDVLFIQQRNIDRRAVLAGQVLNVVLLDAAGLFFDAIVRVGDFILKEVIPFLIRKGIIVQNLQLTAQVCHKVSIIMDREVGIALLLQHLDKCLLQRSLTLVGIRTFALRFVFCYNGTFVAGSNYIVSAHAPNSLNVKSLSR